VGPIDEFLSAEETQDLLPHLLPDAGLVPIVQSSPTGHATAAAHLHGKFFPRRAGLEDEEDADQTVAIGHARTAAFGRGLLLGKERLDELPQFVRNERLGHDRVLPDYGHSEMRTRKSVKAFC